MRNSALQHLGFANGQNSSLSSGDYGRGFADDVVEYLYFITEEIVRAQKSSFKQLDARLSNIERIFAAITRQG